MTKNVISYILTFIFKTTNFTHTINHKPKTPPQRHHLLKKKKNTPSDKWPEGRDKATSTSPYFTLPRPPPPPILTLWNTFLIFFLYFPLSPTSAIILLSRTWFSCPHHYVSLLACGHIGKLSMISYSLPSIYRCLGIKRVLVLTGL